MEDGDLLPVYSERVPKIFFYTPATHQSTLPLVSYRYCRASIEDDSSHPGRPGLGGCSLQGGSVARFADYLFANNTCPFPG